jgi:RNA polymerase sigma-70 factor (ECF subfamily)
MTLRLQKGTNLRLVRRTGGAEAGERAEVGTEAIPAERLTPEPPEAAPERPRGAHAELEDEGLVALACQGDNRAAEVLYRRHATFAFNLAARIAGSTTDVEDVVHDSFLRAFDELATLRNPAAFRSWLGSIVVHGMRSRLRRGRWLRFFGLGRAGDPIDIECIASDGASPRVRAELAQLYALLQTLAPDDRIAWTLRCVEGHDLVTAAELTGCSLATVKRRIRRAQSYIEAHYVSNPAASAPGNPAPPRSSSSAGVRDGGAERDGGAATGRLRDEQG